VYGNLRREEIYDDYLTHKTSHHTAEEARQEVEKIRHKRGVRILPVPVDIVNRWLELLRTHSVTRGSIFDVQLVATMLGNEVRKIYPFNVRDFTPFPELEVLIPTTP
jgi:hypothetical protein